MYKLLNIPFLTLTFSLITGIIFGYYKSTDIDTTFQTQTIAILSLILSWWYVKKIFRNTYIFSILVIVTFFFFGVTLVQTHNPKNSQSHYTNILSEKSLENPVTLSFHIKERLKPTSYYEKYVITLVSLEKNAVTGNMLFQIPKDSLKASLTIGDSYIIYAQIKPISTPLNPNQFDYANYLSKQYIFHVVTTDSKLLISTNNPIISAHSIAHYIRANINQKLSFYFNNKQLSIINALLLGQRQDIDKNTFIDYRDAGAIHILAVSGLHIGILLMILNLILKPLERLKKYGKAVKTILIILLLWCFAVIAGLSPSVLRAVTMFSFIAIGMYTNSRTSIYNALIISMFLLLCVQPLLLFSVGFQLSYIAVFSIVWIQPSLASIYRPTFYLDNILWDTFTVTIAAQLGLLPLSLYYFHQFPLLFFVANLIIIPVLGIILGYGILVIILGILQLLPNWLAIIFGDCINVMNNTVHWVSKQEAFLITEITFSWRMLITGYIFIIAFVSISKKYSVQRLYVLVGSILILSFVLTYEKHIYNNQEELIVFHNRRNTTLGILQNQQLDIYSKDSISEITKNYVLKNYLIENKSLVTSNKKLKNVYNYREKVILIIDSFSVYNVNGLRPDIVILSNSPKIHLNRVLDVLHPQQIIGDGSNYKSYLDQWELTCEQKNIPFHRTDKKGAFIFNE
ncbi:ComEC/Rec2 family competence protein [Aquimarina sp. 2201CG14-23]|uniref:ComEC/Rec2 family competence protein n=1 Tax=Aquimarina mycalae TaxID=3040073 RepID=UPI002477FC1A|nr:ComEC/Rec2 family competence protein [Aquimarina sp. 2201CG14-23]MDH7445483.1 ComEC/Rec2 family competence protein [Aquimarina sp. 2201CG14-23]